MPSDSFTFQSTYNSDTSQAVIVSDGFDLAEEWLLFKRLLSQDNVVWIGKPSQFDGRPCTIRVTHCLYQPVRDVSCKGRTVHFAAACAVLSPIEWLKLESGNGHASLLLQLVPGADWDDTREEITQLFQLYLNSPDVVRLHDYQYRYIDPVSMEEVVARESALERQQRLLKGDPLRFILGGKMAIGQSDAMSQGDPLQNLAVMERLLAEVGREGLQGDEAEDYLPSNVVRLRN